MRLHLGVKLKQIINVANNELNSQILDFCRHVAGSQNIAAIAHVDNYSMKPILTKKQLLR